MTELRVLSAGAIVSVVLAILFGRSGEFSATSTVAIDASAVTTLLWRRGAASTTVSRRAGVWRMDAWPEASVNERAVTEVIDAVGQLSLLRAVDRPRGVPRFELSWDGGRLLAFDFEDSKRYAVVTTHGGSHIVPAHELVALDVKPEALVVTHPFRGVVVATAAAFDLPGKHVALGRQPRIASIAGQSVVLNDGRWRALLSALDEVKLVPGPARAADSTMKWEVHGPSGRQTLRLIGSCEDGMYVSTSVGFGCVPWRQFSAVTGLVGLPLSDWSEELLFDVSRVTRVVTKSLALSLRDRSWRADDQELDVRHVHGWLRAFASQGSGRFVFVPKGFSVMATVSIGYRSGMTTLVRLLKFDDNLVVQRGNEPIAQPVPGTALGMFAPTVFDIAPRQLVAREGIEMFRAVARERGRAVHDIRRGQLLGEWNAKSGAVDTRAMQALVDAITHLRAEVGTVPVPKRSADRIVKLSFEPPPMGTAQSQVHLTIWKATSCTVQVDGTGAGHTIDDDACAALLGRWAQ